MSDVNWVKDLVRFEKELEESGMVDINAGFDPTNEIIRQSYEFMFEMKNSFLDYINAFNELKGGGLGCVKIYGISNTKADFMLFRNGFKLIFRLVEAGKVTVTSRQPNANITPGSFVSEGGAEIDGQQDILLAQWGAFGELKWTYQNQIINPDFLIRHYLTRFIKESAK